MLARRHILNIKNYEPGKPIEEVQRELGLREVVKMASNENCLGPSPKAVAAVRKNLKNLNRYPDSNSFYLKQKLAKRLKVKSANLIIGNGSDELIVLALRAFLNEGEEVIIADTTFLIYEIASQVANASVIVVPMKDLRYDLKAIRKEITPRTKIIFIANPDNPTSTYVTEKEVAEFMEGLPGSVIVFFDEAYYEFGRVRKDYPNTMRYLKRGNVIIARTFSKAYGLSGIRLGYGIADAGLISYMEKIREPFNVNILAQAAGAAALDDKRFLARSVAHVEKGKKLLCREFDKLGLEYVRSATNFIIVNVRHDSGEVFKKMLSLGVIIRDMKAWGLDTYIRVTVGTDKENKKFINALEKVLRGYA
jgi:histidinol-phosphate aminotransferase